MDTSSHTPPVMRKCYFKIELEYVPRNGFVIESEAHWTAELPINFGLTEIQGEIERKVRKENLGSWKLVLFQRF